MIDLNLPEISGTALIGHLHADPWWRDIPLIAISASIPLDPAFSADLPVAAVLPKPFALAKLLACVAAAAARVGRQQSARR